MFREITRGGDRQEVADVGDVAAALADGDLAKATLLPAAPVGERAWIQFELPQAQTIRGVTFVTAGGELFWGNDRLEQALRWAKRDA